LAVIVSWFVVWLWRQPIGAIPIGGQDESLPVEETIGILHGSQSPPEGCKFPPGTVQMMSFQLNSEHEYSVKVPAN
jgi:hypothetical protein